MPETALRRVVVSGLGVVNPLGTDVDRFWANVLEGRSAVRPISRFDPEGLPVRLAAEVSDFDVAVRVPRRLAVKSDRFAHLALDASDQALSDAGLRPKEMDPFRVGISFGNNSGGWDICERGFVEYYNEGPTMINPWQATAWFPTAPQGFVSIRHGIRGFSKSFACDRASGACGLLFAHRSIAWGYNDVVLAGGTEAPITRLGVAAHVSTGDLSRHPDPSTAYHPFSARRAGLVLGEGAAVLVFEDRDHAIARGAHIYGEILAVEQRTGEPDRPDPLVSALEATLRRAERAADDVDVVFAEGAGTWSGDRSEAAAVHGVFGPRPVPVTVPKTGYGHLYGASAATELVCAMLAMRDGVIPPTPGVVGDEERSGLQMSSEPAERPVATAMVDARSREGTNVAVLAGRFDRDTRRN